MFGISWNNLILINIIWYTILAFGFGWYEGDVAKVLYWLGAAILSAGVWLM